MLINCYNVVSVMSGTSLDGIDILSTKFEFDNKWKFKILKFETLPYTKEWEQKLKNLTQCSKAQLQLIDADYSTYLGQSILNFIKKNNLKDIDFVASHGHTALHNPEKGYTYQIGNKQEVANIIKNELICDFRVQDVSLGGQGAPLVPVGDKLLFGKYNYCVNLGGFANISFNENNSQIAFDICPLNIVLNYYTEKLGHKYDDEGKIAASGKIHQPLLEELNQLKFYSINPPKSLGLEWVEQTIFPLIKTYNLQINDILRTFVEHAAVQISIYLNTKNALALVTGGGAYNLFLVKRLRAISKTQIIIPSKDIVEYKEALIFGLLGVLRKRNEVNCLKSVTGAEKDHSSGIIFHPIN